MNEEDLDVSNDVEVIAKKSAVAAPDPSKTSEYSSWLSILEEKLKIEMPQGYAK